MSSSMTTRLGATAALAAGAIFYFYMFGNSKKLNEDELPSLTLEETEKVLYELLERMTNVSMKVQEMVQNIQRKFAAQGQQVDMAQVKEHLVIPQFTKEYESEEDAVLGMHDIESEELDVAVNYYSASDEGEVSAIVQRMKLILKTFAGFEEPAPTPQHSRNVSNGSHNSAGATQAARGSELESPVATSNGVSSAVQSMAPPAGEMSFEKIIKVVEALSEALLSCSDDFIVTYKSQFGPPSDEMAMQQFNAGYMQMSQSVEQEILAANGLNETEWRTAVQKYAQDPATAQQFAEKFMQMQMMTGELLQKHGMIPAQAGGMPMM